MAERSRTEGRSQRASARGRRRALVSQPFEALGDGEADVADGDGESGGGAGALAAAKQAARTAAAAAIAGGLAGAAKAMVARRTQEDEDEHEPDRRPEQPAPERDEPADDASDGADDEVASVEEPEDDDEVEPAPAPEVEPAPAPRAETERPERGASGGEAGDVVERARQYVADLLGKEAESVSGIARGNGSWTVSVEVVDVHRIPESTDVLASYEVALDDDGGLLSLERRGRYRRSQVEEGR